MGPGPEYEGQETMVGDQGIVYMGTKNKGPWTRDSGRDTAGTG